MLNNTLARLAELHIQLSPLLSPESPELNARLNELAAITQDLQRLHLVGSELNHLSGALGLLLELLDAAHNRQLDGGQLQCLLQPLVEQLVGAERVLDEVI